MYQFRQLPPNVQIVEVSSGNTGPKDKDAPLSPEQENWPEDKKAKTYIIPDVPPLSEGAPNVANLAKNLPGAVTIRQIKTNYQPQIEQKMVHVTADGTVTGITLGAGNTLQSCVPGNNQWFRLVPDDVTTSDLNNKPTDDATSSDKFRGAADLNLCKTGVAVFELETNVQSEKTCASQLADVTLEFPAEHAALTSSDHGMQGIENVLNDNSAAAEMQVLVVNDLNDIQCVELIRKDYGRFSVAQKQIFPTYDVMGRKLVKTTKTWVSKSHLMGLCVYGMLGNT